jgi:alkylation response protein AidB-like acyl-CoA dehydrogenase
VPQPTPAPPLATSAAERDDLRAMVRAFARDHFTLEEVRRVSGTQAGYDPAVWKSLGVLGLTGLLVPAGFGGAGYGLPEASVVLQALGRALACVPYLSSAVLAVTALLASEDEAAQAELLPRLAAGELLAAVAVSGPAGRADGTPGSLGVTASPSLRGVTLDGEEFYVVDGHVAGVLLVAARDSAGISLYRVAGDAPGLSRSAMPVIDATRTLARAGFHAVAARPLGAPGSGAAALARVLDTGAVALAAEAVGGAEQAWTWRSATRGSACSSAARSARSRPLSTSARTCWWRWRAPGSPWTGRWRRPRAPGARPGSPRW